MSHRLSPAALTSATPARVTALATRIVRSGGRGALIGRGVATAVVLAVALTGCAGSAANPGPADPAPGAGADAAADAAAAGTVDPATSAGPAVKLGSTSLGDVLVGPDGLTLYAFTNDTDGASTCTGTCAEAWPPLIVGPDWDPGPELDEGIFATTTREDGSLQLVAGKWPLYYYAGDSAPGDVTGQGSGDVWFVVDATGKLVEDPAPAGSGPAVPSGEGEDGAEGPSGSTGSGPVRLVDSELGRILVDEQGRTLYGFTKDTAGTPTCAGTCATTWPAVTVEGDRLPAGLDPAVFSVVRRPDGRHQLKAGTWPLYRFAGDAAPGATEGQGSGGAWFVVDGTGTLVKQAPAGGGSGAGGNGNGGGAAKGGPTTTAGRAPSGY